MWRDGILQPQSDATTDSNSNSSSSNTSAVYTLTQNTGIFASNFIPLWAGLAGGDVLTGSRAVDSLNKSGLVQPAGGAQGRGWGYCLVGCTAHMLSKLRSVTAWRATHGVAMSILCLLLMFFC